LAEGFNEDSVQRKPFQVLHSSGQFNCDENGSTFESRNDTMAESKQGRHCLFAIHHLCLDGDLSRFGSGFDASNRTCHNTIDKTSNVGSANFYNLWRSFVEIHTDVRCPTVVEIIK
jgi:hypothetical protein